MADPYRRKKLEADLTSLIRKAETNTLNNPQLKAMAQKLRTLYREDKKSILSLMGPTPPASPSRPVLRRPRELPHSKIPELLMTLNSLADMSRHPRTSPHRPSSPKISGVPSASLPSSTQSSTFVTDQPKKAAQILNKLSGAIQKEISRIETELQDTRMMLATIKKDEGAVRSRNGIYKNPVQRLQAERLLRELPGKIIKLEQERKLLEEELQNHKNK